MEADEIKKEKEVGAYIIENFELSDYPVTEYPVQLYTTKWGGNWGTGYPIQP